MIKATDPSVKDQVAETPKTPGATTDKAAAAKDNKPLHLPQAHRR